VPVEIVAMDNVGSVGREVKQLPRARIMKVFKAETRIQFASGIGYGA
jgi:hypothetical protein